MVLLAQTKMDSAFAALFWFDDGYEEIVDEQALVEFSKAEYLEGSLVQPSGNHLDFDPKADEHNRGRIFVYRGIIELWVGNKCPQALVDEVKKRYGVGNWKVNVERSSEYDRGVKGFRVGILDERKGKWRVWTFKSVEKAKGFEEKLKIKSLNVKSKELVDVEEVVDGLVRNSSVYELSF